MQITLNMGTVAMTDTNEPFVLPDVLNIEIVSPVYRLDTIVLTAKNGDVKEQFKIKEKPFAIALKDTVKAGKIDLEISNVIQGEVVKSWRVPSIIIKEIEHRFEAIPEIEELKREIALVKQGIAEIMKLI